MSATPISVSLDREANGLEKVLTAVRGLQHDDVDELAAFAWALREVNQRAYDLRARAATMRLAEARVETDRLKDLK